MSSSNPPYPQERFPMEPLGYRKTSSSTLAPYPTVPYPGFMPYSQNINQSNDSFGLKIEKRALPVRMDSGNSVETLPRVRNNSLNSMSTFNSQFSGQNKLQRSPDNNEGPSTVDNLSDRFTKVEISIPENVIRFKKAKNNAINDLNSGLFTAEIQLVWAKTIFEYTSDIKFISSYNLNGENLQRELSSSDLKKNELLFIKEGVRLLKKLASDSKYAEAQFILGSFYSQSPVIKVVRNNILEKNFEKSFSNYQKAALQSHPLAVYRLGVCYELGIGTSVNQPKALECFNQSAHLGNIQSMFKLGIIYYKGSLNVPKSAHDSVQWLLKASKLADGENPHSLFQLAKYYERDTQTITHDFLRSLDSIGFPHSDDIALSYYQAAAKFQYPPAQYKLGNCYEYGKLGVTIDAKKSIGWYSRSAKNGDAIAEMALSGWYLTGATGILQQNDKEAFLWASKSAQSGYVKAEYALGYYYEVGLGCDVNLELSRKFFIRAANQGHQKAVEMLKR